MVLNLRRIGCDYRSPSCSQVTSVRDFPAGKLRCYTWTSE